MNGHNDNDGIYFVDDVLNADDNDDNEDDYQYDVDVPYGIDDDDDDDDNINVHDDDACHHTSGYCRTWDIEVNNK